MVGHTSRMRDASEFAESHHDGGYPQLVGQCAGETVSSHVTAAFAAVEEGLGFDFVGYDNVYFVPRQRVKDNQ